MLTLKHESLVSELEALRAASGSTAGELAALRGEHSTLQAQHEQQVGVGKWGWFPGGCIGWIAYAEQEAWDRTAVHLKISPHIVHAYSTLTHFSSTPLPQVTSGKASEVKVKDLEQQLRSAQADARAKQVSPEETRGGNGFMIPPLSGDHIHLKRYGSHFFIPP